QTQNLGVIQTTSIGGSASYGFTPLLRARVGASYRENEFTGIGSGGTTSSVNNTKTITAEANVTYQITNWLTATLDASHTRVESGASSASSSSFDENRVRISLNAILY